MAMDNFRATIVAQLNEFIKNYMGVKQFHLDFKTGTKGLWNVRDSITIRLWINKEQFNAYDVAAKLEEIGGFKENIKKI